MKRILSALTVVILLLCCSCAHLADIWDIINTPDVPVQPDTPDTPDNPEEPEDTWANVSAGYRIRLKTYKNSPDRMHKGRKCSVKIDTKFHTEQGMSGGNTTVFVDDGELKYYGIDAENGKHDLCFADYERYPEQQNKPCYLKIYKDGKLHTVCKIPEWKYGAITVGERVEIEANDPPVKPDTPKNNPDINSTKIPDGWSKNTKRNWNAGRAKPNQYYGKVQCSSREEATNFRYALRPHFEWDLNVLTAFPKPDNPETGCVNITVNSDNSVTWKTNP
jgi:hypothetical protein